MATEETLNQNPTNNGTDATNSTGYDAAAHLMMGEDAIQNPQEAANGNSVEETAAQQDTTQEGVESATEAPATPETTAEQSFEKLTQDVSVQITAILESVENSALANDNSENDDTMETAEITEPSGNAPKPENEGLLAQNVDVVQAMQNAESVEDLENAISTLKERLDIRDDVENANHGLNEALVSSILAIQAQIEAWKRAQSQNQTADTADASEQTEAANDDGNPFGEAFNPGDTKAA